MGETLDYQTYGHYGMLVHSDRPVSDVDWNAYIERRNAWHARLPAGVTGRTVILTDGEGPTARQRMVLKDGPGPKDIPTAVLSLSPASRGIVTAVSWFGLVSARAFKPLEYELAFDWLQVPPGAHRAEILRRLLDMRRQYIGDIPALPIETLLSESIGSLRQKNQPAA